VYARIKTVSGLNVASFPGKAGGGDLFANRINLSKEKCHVKSTGNRRAGRLLLVHESDVTKSVVVKSKTYKKKSICMVDAW
jgi:hypothetical protein